MTALNPVERVGDQIGEVLEIHTDLDAAARRQRVLDVMKAVSLPDPEQMIDAYPHQLSGGQRQRVMIAAALVLDPALLIADEPTTALDVTTQAQILKLIKELQGRRNTGVLFITHDFGVVSEIADRVVVMQNGRVVEQGPRDEILKQPAAALHADADRGRAEPDAAAAPAGAPARSRSRPRSCRRPMAAPAGSAAGPRRQGRAGRHHRGPPRRDARHRRRIRLRQIDGCALHRAAGRSDRRRSDDRRRRHRAHARGHVPPLSPPRAGRVPGPLSLAQSAPHGRRSRSPKGR